jgi:hypothetical protein
MKRVSFGEGAAAIMMALAVLVLFLVAGVSTSGCVSGGDSAGPAWPPDVAFRDASVKGSVELATPAGPVTVDLSTGIVEGDGDFELVRVDLEANASFVVNGLAQAVRVASPGSEADDGKWAQCVEMSSLTEVYPGVAVVLRAKPPGLHDACGEPAFEVSTSVRSPEVAPPTPLPADDTSH